MYLLILLKEIGKSSLKTETAENIQKMNYLILTISTKPQIFNYSHLKQSNQRHYSIFILHRRWTVSEFLLINIVFIKHTYTIFAEG